MNRIEVTRHQLEQAHRFCCCSGDLDEALKSKALSIALRNVAASLFISKPKRIDLKRLIAGDRDE